MAKTVPQLQKIDRRADPEQVETISSPYEWQRKLQQTQRAAADASEQHIKTVPIDKGPRGR